MSINAGIGASGARTSAPVIGPPLEGPPVVGTGLPVAAPDVAPAARPGPPPDAAAAPARAPRDGSVLQELRKSSKRKPSAEGPADEAGDEPSADLPAPSRRAALLLYDIAEHLGSQPGGLSGLTDLLTAGCTPETPGPDADTQGTCSWCGDAGSQQQIAALAQPSEGRRAVSMLLLTLAIEDHQMRHGDPFIGFRHAAGAARRYAQLGASRAPAWLRPVMERVRDASPEQMARDLSEQLRQSVTGGAGSLAQAWERFQPLRPSRLLMRRQPRADSEPTGPVAADEAGAIYLRRGVLLA